MYHTIQSFSETMIWNYDWTKVWGQKSDYLTSLLELLFCCKIWLVSQWQNWKVRLLFYFSPGLTKVRLFLDGSCTVLSSFKIVVIFNNTSAEIKTKSADVLQVNIFQKLLFLHQLTHSMTTDCSWNYHENYKRRTWAEHVLPMFCSCSALVVFMVIPWTIFCHIVG